MEQREEHHGLDIPHSNGEVREEKKEASPELGSMHITPECNSEPGSIESDESRRTRTESTASVNSESWQTNDEMIQKLRCAQSLLENGASPLMIIIQMFPDFDISKIRHMSERAHMNILGELLEQAPHRQKIPTYNSLSDAVELFRTRKNILILTGAGVSVSCGIPDFRSKEGIYARLRSEFPDLPDPTAMFDIRYFHANPAPFYNFAREIFPGQFVPSVSHRFIKQLENTDRLLRNYTQNIDTLEHQTGIKRVVECHGSFSKCTCTKCGFKYEGDKIRKEVLEQRIAYCDQCQGVIKPNIVFFGEDLGQDFHRCVTEDKNKVDLVVVIGSSLKVRPVALIPHCVGKDVPQILINRESLPHYKADIELLGNCDDIIRDICFSLGGPFSDMISEYDSVSVSKQAQVSRTKRQLITQEEFLNLCLKRKNGSNEPTDDEKDKIEEPNSKRPRLSVNDEEGHSRKNFEDIQTHKEDEDDDTQDSEDVLNDIKAPRLLDINSFLEENKCVAISTNQTIFPGAEYLFDLETLKLVRDVHHDDACSSSSCSSDCESQGSSPLSKSTSVDDIVYDEYRKNNATDVIVRCDSCDFSFDYELSEGVDPETFRQLFEGHRI
uniref:NAD-dependent protein deacetylase sir-2.1 n=1 Tax=Caenorhabditis japonica TaxID=281687 RepID=A0A8R1HL65_CAEJA